MGIGRRSKRKVENTDVDGYLHLNIWEKGGITLKVRMINK